MNDIEWSPAVVVPAIFAQVSPPSQMSVSSNKCNLDLLT
jgi:hypothetical protein